jgi:hypothetical protein
LCEPFWLFMTGDGFPAQRIRRAGSRRSERSRATPGRQGPGCASSTSALVSDLRNVPLALGGVILAAWNARDDPLGLRVETRRHRGQLSPQLRRASMIGAYDQLRCEALMPATGFLRECAPMHRQGTNKFDLLACQSQPNSAAEGPYELV